MPYLDVYTQPLTAKTAAHLLRRATFGPTQAEITLFTSTGPTPVTATQAVQLLISNANLTTNPPQPPAPIDLKAGESTYQQPYFDKPFNGDRNFEFGHYIRHWWIGQMLRQDNPIKPSLLDKLTLFWQNHFVTTREEVDDHRFVWRYLKLLRTNALGNFRFLVTEICKDPAMLKYLNGNENEKGKPNENLGRELQELFTVGAFDVAGIKNYTEEDVKAAARVLTGWKFSNYYTTGSTTIATTFTDSKHDATNKLFSAKYNNTTIIGRAVSQPGTMSAGNDELTDLVTMLLNHPETPKFICRKLYRWYVNPNVTPFIETNVIVPLAQFFASPTNNYAIQPVLVKLLTSQIFFDDASIGAIVKSPAEVMIGTLRFFDQPLPDMLTDTVAFHNLINNFMFYRLQDMQLKVLDQSSVFGYEPYYQTGYSRIWINTTTVALRNSFTDAIVTRSFTVKTGYKLGVDPLAWATTLQTNFSSVPSPPPASTGGTPSITCVQVLDAFTKNLFATDLFQTQKDFLIDTIMMEGIPRTSWENEWNLYRRTVTTPASYTATQITNAKNAVIKRLQTNLMKYLLRMAEYHVF